MTAPAPARKWSPARMLLRAAGYMSLVAFSALLALLVAEFAVRVAAPQQLIQIRPDLWQAVDSIGYAHQPSVDVRMNTGEREVSVRTDADGFRIGTAGRRDAAASVLLIGDSFAEALQVEHEQSFAFLLERSMETRLGRSVVVRNAGVGGYGPNHYLLLTRRALARAPFALVVATLFVGNDAIDTRVDYLPPRTPVERQQFRFPRALGRSELVSALLAPMNDALEVRSHLFVLVKNQLATVRMRMGLTADYLPLAYQRAEAASPRWSVTAALSHDLAAAAKAHGAPTLFVLIPERFQVYEDEFARYITGFSVDPATLDLDQPSRLLAESLRAEGLLVVDALEEFRAVRGDGPRLFGTVDQHLSPRGHEVLAHIIDRAVATLVPK